VAPAPDPQSTPTLPGARPLGTVLVTGAASGLGAAVAAAVRDAGGTALAIDRVPVEGCDGEVVDLADGRATEAAVTRLAERAGGLDGVFTAAGTDRCGRLVDVPGDDWDRVLLVNLLGTAAVVRAALPFLERRGAEGGWGTVVTCASTLGVKAVSDATAYCASKFGVVGFTRALADELRGRVGVTLLVPGGMHTAFFDDRDEQYKPPPDAKLNRPEDTARAVLFALTQPPGSEIKEMLVASSWEGSYP
jgi:NAD(P)-dependent dehydrogenase (short-subunit alcohol dehydrogenase family)